MAKNSKTPTVKLSPREHLNVYAARRFLGTSTKQKLDLSFLLDVYYKDPLVASNNPGLEIDDDFWVPWEPRIGDGPTSARFAVVDYDSTANKLHPPARWDGKTRTFLNPRGFKVSAGNKNTQQFRQVSTWAIVQSTLDYFESAAGLGRRIMWGFEGNRLLVVPTAGYDENAYYDRHSKSLQLKRRGKNPSP